MRYSKITKVKKILKQYQKMKFVKQQVMFIICYRPGICGKRDTTKIRAVFDASYSSNGPSVNDCLDSGPNLLTKIFDISTTFRFSSIVILADIKQAFLNVEISKEHGDYLRFLW